MRDTLKEKNISFLSFFNAKNLENFQVILFHYTSISYKNLFLFTYILSQPNIPESSCQGIEVSPITLREDELLLT